MIYDVTLDDRTLRVEVKRHGEAWLVRTGNGAWSTLSLQQRGMDWIVEDAGRTRHLSVAQHGNEVCVLDGVRTRIGVVVDPRNRLFDDDKLGGEGEVRTAMPGAVTRVAVKAGERVVAGDVIVVIEAMKMQNEFRATCSGTLQELYVVEGDTVEANAILASIIPDDHA